MIDVIVADDHLLFAEGVSQALAAVPDMRVVETVTNGRDLLEAVRVRTPDVLLVDLEMPNVGGLQVLGQLGETPPAIIVTMHTDPSHRIKAAEAGAAGFMSKSTPLPDLAAAVRAVAAGENLIEATTLREVLDRHAEPRLDPGAASLTARERQILGLLGEGVSTTGELADRLYISQKTVKNHLASIYVKLGVADRTQAAIEAIRLGLTPRR